MSTRRLTMAGALVEFLNRGLEIVFVEPLSTCLRRLACSFDLAPSDAALTA